MKKKNGHADRIRSRFDKFGRDTALLLHPADRWWWAVGGVVTAAPPPTHPPSPRGPPTHIPLLSPHPPPPAPRQPTPPDRYQFQLEFRWAGEKFEFLLVVFSFLSKLESWNFDITSTPALGKGWPNLIRLLLRERSLMIAARVFEVHIWKVTSGCEIATPTVWRYLFLGRSNGSFSGNTAFNMAPTKIASKYKKKAIYKIYPLLEFHVATVSSFRDINFQRFFKENPIRRRVFNGTRKRSQ